MKTALHIAEIIVRHLNGTITPRENAELQEWLDSSPNNRQMMEEFATEGYLEQQQVLHRLFDVERGYSRFQSSKRTIIRKRKLVRFSAAAAVIALLGAGWWLATDRSADGGLEKLLAQTSPARPAATLIRANGERIEITEQTNRTLEEQDARLLINSGSLEYSATGGETADFLPNTLITPRGGEHSITLSDGTRIWLSPETKLRYPSVFAGPKREVILSGEAYFEVAEDADRPFIIHTDNTGIEVLGTSFNVRAYDGEPEQTTLVEGKIRAVAAGREQVLQPGDQLTVADGQLTIRQVPVEGYRLWKNNRFIFNDAGIEEVVQMLERWYDIPISVADPAVKELRFTGSIPKYDDMKAVLHKLELTTNIHFGQSGDGIAVTRER